MRLERERVREEGKGRENKREDVKRGGERKRERGERKIDS